MVQIRNLANLPFVVGNVAIMADTHTGYGMPIGGVVGLDGVVIPNGVGVDIGCGMVAVKTSLKEISKDMLKVMMGDIRKAIPVGFEWHEKPMYEKMPSIGVRDVLIIHKNWETAARQIGTLGGGNHFIEIQKGNDGHIWFMIHSGSRGLGKKIADHYDDIAKKLNKQWHVGVPESFDLAFLPLDTEEGAAYWSEMNYALEYASANRALMVERMKEIFKRHNDVDFLDEIDIHHNYAAIEKHFNKEVVVHRKGATRAEVGERGIIPGSQGAPSYIVEGLSNGWSLRSCSHGAGRKLARKQAERELNLAEEIKKLDEVGVIHGVRLVRDLDEAPGAYKDIKRVMKNQEDLVRVVVELMPLAVIKG